MGATLGVFGRWDELRMNLEMAADRLAWWLRTRRFAGSTTATIEEKIAETRTELAMLNRAMMRMRASSDPRP